MKIANSLTGFQSYIAAKALMDTNLQSGGTWEDTSETLERLYSKQFGRTDSKEVF